jgi:hypothetical protein
MKTIVSIIFVTGTLALAGCSNSTESGTTSDTNAPAPAEMNTNPPVSGIETNVADTNAPVPMNTNSPSATSTNSP